MDSVFALNRKQQKVQITASIYASKQAQAKKEFQKLIDKVTKGENFEHRSLLTFFDSFENMLYRSLYLFDVLFFFNFLTDRTH